MIIIIRLILILKNYNEGFIYLKIVMNYFCSLIYLLYNRILMVPFIDIYIKAFMNNSDSTIFWLSVSNLIICIAIGIFFTLIEF